jgi:uncharacterized damage-inducible protein DinB
MERALVVPSLAVGPHLLRALTADATPEQVWTPPKTGEWSMGDVARHLVAADQRVFLPRLEGMLAESRPTFGSVTDVLAPGRELNPLLDAFAAHRARLVASLEALGPEEWLREGVIPRGTVTVEAYAVIVAEHDVEHRRQIHDIRESLGLNPKRAEAKRPLPMPEILAAMAAAPEAVRGAAKGMTVARMRQRPPDGGWSVKEIMAHLLKVERDLFLTRLGLIASVDCPSFPMFDPDAWARERDHREGDFEEEWRLFEETRAKTVALLRGLPPKAEERLGLSGFFGPVTLLEYATHVVDHDHEHLAQIARTRVAVGG